MIREKLILSVHGANQVEIRRRVAKIIDEYFQIDIENNPSLVDVDIDVTATEGKPESFSATAYVKVKNNA